MSLNSSQKLHLLTSFQYVDKLLGDIEAIMAASSAKSAFPKYKPDISPVQVKIVQDYIDRLRSEMVRVLKDQDIFPPEPRFGSMHSIRITLGLAGIAFRRVSRQGDERLWRAGRFRHPRAKWIGG